MILLMAVALAAANGDVAVGSWKTQTGGGVVQITRCGDSLCGYLRTSDMLRANPGLRDGRNRDASLRTRPLAGVQVLSGFSRAGRGWSGGAIYNGQDGGTYKATITPIDADHLKVRGCIMWPLCKTQTWTPIG